MMQRFIYEVAIEGVFDQRFVLNDNQTAAIEYAKTLKARDPESLITIVVDIEGPE